jgi:uncharacterized membrane protein (DUF485 family)
MDNQIYRNSYIVAIVSFVLLSLIFYVLQIGYTREVVDGKVVRKFGWKYPLAISLLIWVVWKFFLFPSNPDTIKNTNPKSIGITDQKIDMRNWI